MKRPGLLLGFALALLLLAMAGKSWLLALPEVPATAAPGGFDTARAMARLQRILGDQRPHPVDTAAGDAVRERLLGELRTIGLTPVVTDSFTCNGAKRSRSVFCVRVRNVRATIGPAAGRHVLLVSHYDSTPVGPGAADDGIGVATMLETAAVLRQGPLARPVTLLFDEGEEAGLNGARSFLDVDPLAARVDAAINLESRGVTGPAIMFETSRPNGSAIDAFGRSARRPVANSLTADFYRLIPNDTDVTVLKERPWTILNFAIIGNETRYHSAGDTLAELDRRSLRHMGEQALAATETLAGGAEPRSGTRVYADLLGRGLIVLPAALALLMLGLLALGAAAIAWPKRSGLGRAMLAVALAPVASGLAAWAGQRLIGLIRSGDYWRAHPEAISLATDVSALAASLALLAWLGCSSDRERLRSAFWLVFLLIGAGLCLVAPGAAVFFLLPPLVALIGMLFPKAERIAAIIAGLLLFLSWAPLLSLSEVLLDFDAAWVFAAVGALILLPLLIELKPLADAVPARRLFATSGVAVLLGWAITLIPPAYSADRKQAFGIEYVRDQTQRTAQWMVVSDAPLPRGFAGFDRRGKVPWSTRPRRIAPAPALPVPAPRIETLGERRVDGGRLLQLRLHSAGYDSVLLSGAPDAGFLAVRADGLVTRFANGKADERYLLRCQGRSCDGREIELLIDGGKPVVAKLIGIANALPAAAAPLVRARPADAQPQYTPDATISVADVRL